jgi:uncharacterized membrane protein
MKCLISYFFRGIVFLAPLVITLLICWWIFDKIDAPLRPYVWNVPGIAFGLVIVGGMALAVVLGFLASNIITGSVLRLIDGLFGKFPLIKLLYSSVKDLVGAFVGEDKKFDKPVKVELVPGSNIGVIGFVTREDMGDWGLKDQVAVYLPQSYNFAGNLIVIPRERCTPVDVPSGDVMAFIVSGGVTHQEKAGEKK